MQLQVAQAPAIAPSVAIQQDASAKTPATPSAASTTTPDPSKLMTALNALKSGGRHLTATLADAASMIKAALSTKSNAIEISAAKAGGGKVEGTLPAKEVLAAASGAQTQTRLPTMGRINSR